MNIQRREFLTGAAALSLVGWRRMAEAAGYPDYYAAHLKHVSDRVNALAKTCPDGFWFMTDLHVKSNRCRSGELMAALSKTTPLKRVLCGGDLVEAFGKAYPTDRAGVDFAIDTYRRRWLVPLREAGCRLYTAKGNHDFTICHSYDTPEDKKRGWTMDGVSARNFIVGEATESGIVTNTADPAACYYYFDNAAAKVRYVVIDTTDTETAGDVPWAVHYSVSPRQLAWLETEAFGTTPAGWGLVVMHHVPVTGVVGSEKDVIHFKPLRELLERYQRQGRGRILVDLTGHHHCEMETFQRGILHVTNPCDAAYMDYIDRSKPWCGDLPTKDAGTIAEQTFDAVQIDMARDLIHFTRVGGGQDRSFHLKSLSAKVGEPLGFASTLLKGRVTWGCFDADRVTTRPHPTNRFLKNILYHNDRATITVDGTLHPTACGEIVVIAMDEHLNKEIFPVEIGG